MKQHYPDINTLLAYIEGRLPLAERQRIETMMETDPGLAVEIGELEMAAKRGQLQERIDVHGSLIKTSMPRASAPKTFFQRYGMSLAAGLLILLAAGFLFTHVGSPTEDALDMLAWHEVPTVRGEQSQKQLQINDALRLGVEGKWAESLEALQSLAANTPNDSDPNRYLGRALYLAGHHQKAIMHMSRLIDAKETLSRTRLELRWYRALAYIAEGDCASAQQDLQRVQTEGWADIQKKAADIAKKCRRQ